MFRLPVELVHHILEYDGRMKYRNGKYMNQITKDDDRYKMLQQIPQIVTYTHNHHLWYITIYSLDKQCCFVKYNCDWSSETPYIHSYSTHEISVYFFNKQYICYKFMILRQSKPISFIQSILQILYDNFTGY